MTKNVKLEEAIEKGNRWYLTEDGVQVSMLGAGANFSNEELRAYNPYFVEALKSMLAAPKLYRRDSSLSGEYVRTTVQNFLKPFTITDAEGNVFYVHRIRAMDADHSVEQMKLSVVLQKVLMLSIAVDGVPSEWRCMTDIEHKDVVVDKATFNDQVPGWHERFCAAQALGLSGENIANFVFATESMRAIPDMSNVAFR